jgi:HK97 family phage prohead protease
MGYMNKKVEKQFLQFVASFKSIEEDEMIVHDVVASDDSEDRHGDRVNPEGWDLKNYKKNPIILADHDYRVESVIGTGSGVKIDGNKLVFDKITFSKTNDLAVKAFNLIKEGILKTWSVGFLVKKWGDDKSKYTIQEQELLELSLVAIPANPNAMTTEQLAMVDVYNKSLEAATKEEEPAEPVAEEPPAEPVVEPVVEPIVEEPEETMEQKVNKYLTESVELKAMIKTMVEEAVKEAVTKMIGETDNIKSDEENTDATLLALNAVRQELIAQGKGVGKTLQAFNKLLSNIQKEKSNE